MASKGTGESINITLPSCVKQAAPSSQPPSRTIEQRLISIETKMDMMLDMMQTIITKQTNLERAVAQQHQSNVVIRKDLF